MRRTVGLSLLAAVLAVPPLPVAGGAAEGDLVGRIARQFEQYSVVRAEFVQTKTMAALKRPLVTSGRLVFSRRYGVLWQIEAPYRIAYVLGTERTAEIATDGTRREKNVRDVPGLAQVGRIFHALLGADAAVLHEAFYATAAGGVEKWEIVLKPRLPEVTQHLTGLWLAGGRFIETIRIEETGGDITQIRLRNTQTDDAPTRVELVLFGAEK